MSIIVNVGEDGSLSVGGFELPDHDQFRDVIDALERDEATVGVFGDDPTLWIGLLSAVGNYLYHPREFFLSQLRGHFSSIVTEIHEDYCDSDE